MTTKSRAIPSNLGGVKLKRPATIGVISVATVSILNGLLLLVLSLPALESDLESRTVFFEHILFLTFGLAFICSGIFLFSFNNWSRIFFLATIVVWYLSWLFYVFIDPKPFFPSSVQDKEAIVYFVYIAIFGLLLPLVCFVYLTRPLVKKRFKNVKGERQ